MKRNSFLFPLFAAVLSAMFMPSCRQETLTVSRLRCEYLTDPIAVESNEPLLSWQLYSSLRNRGQTAYQILAASSPSLLSENKADLWDSKTVSSAQSIQVKYKGKSLTSRQTVYWKVRVWDENNKPTQWSQPATWSMGLLQPSDWKAQWIGAMTDPAPE
ncbi:MAG: hypothetical protein LBJ23_09835, partial [Tannerella sp.]|nr:hypothetical protein [Tannerella sp.]